LKDQVRNMVDLRQADHKEALTEAHVMTELAVLLEVNIRSQDNSKEKIKKTAAVV
jgi:hypothetical protein